MAGSVFEEAIDLHLGLLEVAGPPQNGPWPFLRSLGRAETRTFRAVVLENDYLRVTLIPDLGGRIAAIHDRRTGIDIIPRPSVIEPVEGGPRGVDLPFGIEVTLDGGPRLNALGPVLVAADDEGVWLAEPVTGNGLSWHLRVSLPEDRAAIRLELRVYNRSPQAQTAYGGSERSQTYNGGFRANGATREGEFWLYPQGGFTRVEGEAVLDGGLVRFPQFQGLAAYQTDVVDMELVPFTGIEHPAGGGLGGVFSFWEGTFRFQPSLVAVGAKAVLLTEEGQTLEAPLALDPSRTMEIELGDINPKAIVVIDAERRPLAQTPLTAEPAKRPHPKRLDEYTDRDLKRSEMYFGIAPIALREQARRAMVAREFVKCAELFERTLLYNGEDPIAWWGLAAARRLAGDEGERPELMNARWLAPLEPMLRAEAFLSTPVDASADPSGLLAPLGETPDAFVEVAATLLDHGMWQDAARWLDESLRRHDFGVLHLLAAYAHMEGSGLKMEAARHVRLFAENPGPPYIWREIEQKALTRVTEIGFL